MTAILAIIVIAALTGGVVLLLSDRGAPEEEGNKTGNENEERNGGNGGEEETGIDTSDWEEYRNEEFGFSIRYPEDWKVAEERDHPVTPRLNIYKPDAEGNPPYTHHSSGVTHVSIFPQGIPTEGILGDSRESEVNFGVEAEEPRDYILADGAPFATAANFVSPPADWNQSGFIVAKTPIRDPETECLRDGEPLPKEEECRPLTGDRLIRRGSVNKEDRAIQKAILESFRFESSRSPDNDAVDNGEAGKEDLIRVSEPEENAVVSDPLKISGEAEGPWYFEGDFPVRLEDAEGNEIGRHYAQAQGEWMTEDLVEFEAELSFEEPSTDTGVLILEKANPSGLKENADEVRIPIRFTDEKE